MSTEEQTTTDDWEWGYVHLLDGRRKKLPEKLSTCDLAIARTAGVNLLLQPQLIAGRLLIIPN